MLSARVQALAPSIIREMSNRRRPDSINLSLGEPRLTTDDEILDRAWGRLRSGPQGYTHNAGLMELRSAIAAHYGFEGRAQGENVIVTVGSEEAVYLALLCTLDPGDEVLVPDPGYPAYRGIAGLVGATPVAYPIDRATGLAPRAAALAARITDRTRVVVLNGPSNPFGTVDTAEELRAIVALADQHELTIISDEIYRELYYGDSAPPSSASMSDRVIFVSGLSKCCAMTGLRLGYLIADEGFVKKATLAHQLLVTCAPRVAQYAALEVFSQPELLRAQVPVYSATRTVARAASASLPDNAPLILGGGAFYALIDIAAYAAGDPLALAIELLDVEDVVVVPGTAFGTAGDWFWRLSYAAGDEAVRTGIERIGRFLRSR